MLPLRVYDAELKNARALKVTRGLCYLAENRIDPRKWLYATKEWETKNNIKGEFISPDEERRARRSKHPLAAMGRAPQKRGRPNEAALVEDLLEPNNLRSMLRDTLDHSWNYECIAARLKELGVVKAPQAHPETGQRFKQSQREDITTRWLVSLSPM